MNSTINAIVLGLVEGITEFLPISSTGHLLIAEKFLKSHQSDAWNIAIQVGPIAAVTLVFWRRIWELFIGWRDKATRQEALMLILSFFLTGVGGLFAKKLGLKLPETLLPIALATLGGALVIFWVESRAKLRVEQGNHGSEWVTWQVAVAVAVGQILAAVFPGTSRSGAAILGAMILGLARPAAVRFAFLVGIPTLISAAGLQIFGAIKEGKTTDLFNGDALIAYAAATLSAWLSVVWLLRFVQSRTLIAFAWYRVVLGLVLLATLFFS